uniref:Uncharacterized protein n=1 Tax=Solanum lycopersicum TaxID=4081 RepID=A0A3Q7HE38_SOLLC
MREETRACRALALFQFTKIPHYFYPFLKPCVDDKPLEYVRITSLSVLGASFLKGIFATEKYGLPTHQLLSSLKSVHLFKSKQ